MQISVVMPVYNEENILWESSQKMAGAFDSIFGSENWKFVYVDNGSEDGTARVIEKIAKQWPHTHYIRLDTANFGAALREGLSQTQTEWALYVCPDEWDVPFISWAWANRSQHDLIFGSKLADPTLNKQHWYRRLLSWGLNSLLAYFLYHSGTDTHGQKMLRMAALRPILEQCEMSWGQFDTEFTLRAVRAGLSVVEIPVEYDEVRAPRNWMIIKILRNVRDVYRLYRVMKTVPFQRSIRLRRWAREDALEAVKQGQ